MFKLIALGALGYLGYRHFSGRTDNASYASEEDDVRLAGGPLSERARVVHPAGTAGSV